MLSKPSWPQSLIRGTMDGFWSFEAKISLYTALMVSAGFKCHLLLLAVTLLLRQGSIVTKYILYCDVHWERNGRLVGSDLHGFPPPTSEPSFNIVVWMIWKMYLYLWHSSYNKCITHVYTWVGNKLKLNQYFVSKWAQSFIYWFVNIVYHPNLQLLCKNNRKITSCKEETLLFLIHVYST